MRLRTDLIRYTVQDLKDWYAMTVGNFKKLSIPFNLMNSLSELDKFSVIQLRNKPVKMFFRQNFGKLIDNNQKFV